MFPCLAVKEGVRGGTMWFLRAEPGALPTELPPPRPGQDSAAYLFARVLTPVTVARTLPGVVEREEEAMKAIRCTYLRLDAVLKR